MFLDTNYIEFLRCNGICNSWGIWWKWFRVRLFKVNIRIDFLDFRNCGLGSLTDFSNRKFWNGTCSLFYRATSDAGWTYGRLSSPLKLSILNILAVSANTTVSMEDCGFLKSKSYYQRKAARYWISRFMDSFLHKLIVWLLRFDKSGMGVTHDTRSLSSSQLSSSDLGSAQATQRRQGVGIRYVCLPNQYKFSGRICLFTK